MNGNARIKANVAARSIAQIGLARDENHNYYLDGQGPIPSVTTILKVIDKGYRFNNWLKRTTAEASVRHADDLPKWIEEFGGEGAVGMLTRAADVARDKAANIGSDVHQLADAMTKGQPVEIPSEIAPFLTAYMSWMRDFEPEFLAAEEMVYSRHGYAGTMDAIVRISGEVWLLDYKTGKGVFEETALQLAAYGAADFIGRPGDPLRYSIPPIDQYGVVHIRPEGAELVPYDVTGAFEAFLAAKRLGEWRSSRQIVGQPIGSALLKFQAPAKEAVA